MEQIPGQKFTVSHEAPLLKYLYEIFPGQSKTGVKAYLSNGQVVLNGKKVTAFDQPLWTGDQLVILPKKLSIYNELKHAARVDVQEYGVEILFEDDYIIVVNKRSGLPVVGTGKSAGRAVDMDKKGAKASLKSQKKENTVYSILCDYVRTKVRAERKSTSEWVPWKPSHVYIVHRLDRDTSGVLVFAKTEKIQKIFQDNWDAMVKERGYVGIVEGAPSHSEGRIDTWLKENPKSMKMVSSRQPEMESRHRPQNGRAEDWLEAITDYRVLQNNVQPKGLSKRRKEDSDGAEPKVYTAVEFSLETGRKNQIRVHSASELGCPIAGDRKYGAKTNPAGRLALHADVLSFIHPVTGKVMTFNAMLPKEFGVRSESATESE